MSSRKVNAMTISFEDIKEICERHKHKNLYFYQEIPPKKLKNASESFKIPETSKVIALYDNTLFGSCKEGLAICSDGLYWQHTSDNKNIVLWDDFTKVGFNSYRDCLTINKSHRIPICNFKYIKVLTKFLLDIKDYINKNRRLDEEVIISKGGTEISYNDLKTICEKYMGQDTYFTNDIPSSKLEDIMYNFGTTRDSKLIGIYDMSLGSFEKGFAICHDGIYFSSSNRFLWGDIISISINHENNNIILNTWYSTTNFISDFKLLSDLFLEIKQYMDLDSLINPNAIKNINNKQILFNSIRNICIKYICSNLYLKNDIDESRLENAKIHFKIPKNTSVITIYNHTALRTCAEGFAICDTGIYSHNYSNGVKWKDFLTLEINYEGSTIILNGHYNLKCFDFDINVIADLFLEINDYMNQPYISKNNLKNTLQKDSEKRILEPNKTKQRKNESDKNTPKFASNKASIDIIQDNQPKNKLTNINNASLDQLIALPYFTLERAEKILSERKNNVIFTSLNDIIDVLNLKPHEAEKLKEYLSFETSVLKKNSAKHEVVKKNEEIINDNINNPIKGRIVDF